MNEIELLNKVFEATLANLGDIASLPGFTKAWETAYVREEDGQHCFQKHAKIHFDGSEGEFLLREANTDAGALAVDVLSYLATEGIKSILAKNKEFIKARPDFKRSDYCTDGGLLIEFPEGSFRI